MSMYLISLGVNWALVAALNNNYIPKNRIAELLHSSYIMVLLILSLGNFLIGCYLTLQWLAEPSTFAIPVKIIGGGN